jgi:HEAT repeat protein
LKGKQSAEPRFKNNKQYSPTPKDGIAIVEPSHQPHLLDGLYVEVQQGGVTLRAENQSLKKVLEALAQKSGVRINTQLITDRVLSIQLVHVPLDRALQTILEFEDSFLAFEHRKEAPAALKAVWVLPAGAGGTWSSHTSACSRDLSELEQQLTSVQSRQRAEAIETLVDLQGPDAAPAVVQSLGDHDENVRYRALQKAHGVGLALPPEVLTELVQHDSSALVRMMAMEAIGNHPSIDEQDKMAFARYAINDGSPAVQTRASELLSHLEFAPLLREQDQALSDEAEQEMSGEFPVGDLDERGE